MGSVLPEDVVQLSLFFTHALLPLAVRAQQRVRAAMRSSKYHHPHDLPILVEWTVPNSLHYKRDTGRLSWTWEGCSASMCEAKL